MLTQSRWSALESFDNIVLGRQKASRFVSLQERTANKEKGKEGQASSSKTEVDEAGEDERLAVQTAVQDRIAKVDEVELFKGGDYEGMLKGFRPEDIPGPRNNILRLRSMPPTDFSQTANDTYWAKTLELADLYAAYHQARNGNDVRRGILHMIIPKAIIESAVEFKTQDHWREYVWLNCLEAETPGTSLSDVIFLN